MKRFYREWMAGCGWGVMLDYDTVLARTRWSAADNKPFGMYAYDKSFETIIRVKKEHLHLSDYELSTIYGRQEDK